MYIVHINEASENEYPHFMFLTINNKVTGVLSCQSMAHFHL